MSVELRGLLTRVVALLDAAGIPFMIAGSFASTTHGIPRSTQDLDVVIHPADLTALQRFLRSLSTDDYYFDSDAALDAFRRRTMFNVIDQATGWKVDFILRKGNAFAHEEFTRRMPLAIVDVPVFVASAEDTIVAKLQWSTDSGGSERQRRDVRGIVETMGPALDRAYVERWVRDLGLETEWQSALATPLR